MRVDNLIIALQEFPPDTEVWLTEDFYGDPKCEVDRLEWKETTHVPRWKDGKPVVEKIKVLCIK